MLSSEIFSASFVSFFTGIIIQFLPRDDFEESLNQAKQRLEVFVNGASQKMKRQESSATTWTNMSGATIHCNMDIFALIEHKGWGEIANFYEKPQFAVFSLPGNGKNNIFSYTKYIKYLHKNQGKKILIYIG